MTNLILVVILLSIIAGCNSSSKLVTVPFDTFELNCEIPNDWELIQTPGQPNATIVIGTGSIYITTVSFSRDSDEYEDIYDAEVEFVDDKLTTVRHWQDESPPNKRLFRIIATTPDKRVAYAHIFGESVVMMTLVIQSGTDDAVIAMFEKTVRSASVVRQSP